ncbi:MAG: nicotinate phosphoribosyltransferase, partial [Hyphomicrobiales bacterium]|nr:nicotinate phosphoribosyltransferase [Hyphomicrobiales bacterium]
RFSDRLVDYLADFRFTGDVDALAEGTVFFADEPIIRIAAPIAQAQLAETRIINFLHYQTLVATKAARMKLAAPDASLVDFGLRRAHSGEAGLLAARAAYIAGFAGTATVPAAQAFGIPIFGTMAHSFVQAHDNEVDAFASFAAARPDQTVFLLDTYDTEKAAEKVTGLAPVLAGKGIAVLGVRLDSGDLAAHAQNVRKILDDAGLNATQIVASGGIDEFELQKLSASAAPINTYGIGTSLVTSEDTPALDCAYKLKAYAGKPRRKLSEGKAFWPGATQAFRRYDANGCMRGDVIGRAGDKVKGEPLLQPIVRNGRLVGSLPTLEAARQHAAGELERMPAHFKRLETIPAYAIDVTGNLRQLADEVDRSIDAMLTAP